VGYSTFVVKFLVGVHGSEGQGTWFRAEELGTSVRRYKVAGFESNRFIVAIIRSFSLPLFKYVWYAHNEINFISSKDKRHYFQGQPKIHYSVFSNEPNLPRMFTVTLSQSCD